MNKSVHYALAEPSRERILGRLRDGGPLDSRELGRDVALHPNTVRSHLRVLCDAGLVRARTERAARVGRPRVLFEAAPPAREAEHELLAAALTEALATLPDAEARAEGAGRHWGRLVAERDAVESLAQLLGERGFEPEERDGELLMHRCPFEGLARARPGVVCALHLGLLRGAQEAIGDDRGVSDLRPFAAQGSCVATFARPV